MKKRKEEQNRQPRWYELTAPKGTEGAYYTYWHIRVDKIVSRLRNFDLPGREQFREALLSCLSELGEIAQAHNMSLDDEFGVTLTEINEWLPTNPIRRRDLSPHKRTLILLKRRGIPDWKS